MWEETLVFMVHMPELALVRFLVWDHDPIGQDFIGQRTISFNSMMPGKTETHLLMSVPVWLLKASLQMRLKLQSCPESEMCLSSAACFL